jgi:hypothetical protein
MLRGKGGNERGLVFHILEGFLLLEFCHEPTTNKKCLLWATRDRTRVLSRSWRLGDPGFREQERVVGFDKKCFCTPAIESDKERREGVHPTRLLKKMGSKGLICSGVFGNFQLVQSPS